ncbi:MAG: phosphate--acyl-ACP acyltransferase [Chloroflexi bacterium HGW-Chloroflexi-1]|nr:MAG: phosphate--acyl-ACP acyltransferase [Chloroflexi bacterium HGW-Chloroflexi-1]
MKVVVDAMGGDHAPGVVVAGAVAEARARGAKIILVGIEDQVRAELAKHQGTATLPIEVVHASEVVAMAEHTLTVKEKPDSSLMVGMRLVKEGRADAFASAGNSGAVMAAALFGLRRIRGVARPALGSIYPAAPAPCLIVDIGANADCKPEYLVQFAQMGAVYARVIFGLDNPTVGIVSNGEEADKGSMLIRETYPLLQASGLNFVGNVEGKDIGKGAANVVVTDGLTGNVIVKLTEGLVSFLGKLLKQELTGGIRNKAALALMIPGLILTLPGLALLYPTIAGLRKQMDWREVGGAPLLGVNGVVVIGHGRSDARAIRSMIRMAENSVRQGLVDAITTALAG